jgi:hypothetical protein
MARFLGSVRCRGGWVAAQVDLRRERRSILIDVVPYADLFARRARRIAVPPEAPGVARRPVTPCDPEICFAALQGGRRVAAARRTVLGRKERWALLQVAYPGLPVPRCPAGAAEADVLDALALAWAAQEIAAGRAPGRFRLVR